MTTITAPPMTRAEAQLGVVHHMLTLHDRQHASELFLVGHTPYRITVTEVPPEEFPQAARQWMEEET